MNYGVIGMGIGLLALVIIFTYTMLKWLNSWLSQPESNYVDNDTVPYWADPVPKTKWEKVVRYFNKFAYVPIKRKEFLTVMLNLKEGDKIPKETIYDQYRCILQEAGFVERLAPGTYVVKQLIPTDLTYREARRQAYDYHKIKVDTDDQKTAVLS